MIRTKSSETVTFCFITIHPPPPPPPFLLYHHDQNKELGQLLWDALEQDRTIELGALTMSFVRFYLSQELIFEYLDAVICRDISRTEDANTLFRGNTLGTKSVDNFMKV